MQLTPKLSVSPKPTVSATPPTTTKSTVSATPPTTTKSTVSATPPTTAKSTVSATPPTTTKVSGSPTIPAPPTPSVTPTPPFTVTQPLDSAQFTVIGVLVAVIAYIRNVPVKELTEARKKWNKVKPGTDKEKLKKKKCKIIEISSQSCLLDILQLVLVVVIVLIAGRTVIWKDFFDKYILLCFFILAVIFLLFHLWLNLRNIGRNIRSFWRERNRFEIYLDANGKYRWRIVAFDNFDNIVRESRGVYQDETKCEKVIKRAKKRILCLKAMPIVFHPNLQPPTRIASRKLASKRKKNSSFKCLRRVVGYFRQR